MEASDWIAPGALILVLISFLVSLKERSPGTSRGGRTPIVRWLQRSWVRILVAAGPILVFVLLLRAANKRAEQKVREREAAAVDPDRDSSP